MLLTNTILPLLVYSLNDEASEVEITPKIRIKGPKVRGGSKASYLAATGVLGTPPPSINKRWAVIIGISDYEGTINDIEYADDDALDMLEALTNIYKYKRSNILLLISNNATRENIVNAINWLKENAKKDSEILFFYSGHGARGKADDGDGEAIDEAIVPYECTAASLIWDGKLRLMFADLKATRIVFVFDSCYSGGMTDLGGEGRIVVMACVENGLSYEGDAWMNGQFTYYFADQGMLKGYADSYPKDGLITVEESFDYANSNCAKQKPTISDFFKNDMLP